MKEFTWKDSCDQMEDRRSGTSQGCCLVTKASGLIEKTSLQDVLECRSVLRT